VLLLRLSQRITVSPMLIISPNKLRRSLLLVPVFLRLVSQTKAANKTRSGPTPRLLARRRKRTSSLVLEERQSVSVNASRSRPSILTNATSRLLSEEVVAVVDSVVAVVVEMLLLVEVEESSVDVVIVAKDADAETEVHPAEELQEAVLVDHPSTLTTPRHSPAWDPRFSAIIRSSLLQTFEDATPNDQEHCCDGGYLKKMEGILYRD